MIFDTSWITIGHCFGLELFLIGIVSELNLEQRWRLEQCWGVWTLANAQGSYPQSAHGSDHKLITGDGSRLPQKGAISNSHHIGVTTNSCQTTQVTVATGDIWQALNVTCRSLVILLTSSIFEVQFFKLPFSQFYYHFSVTPTIFKSQSELVSKVNRQVFKIILIFTIFTNFIIKTIFNDPECVFRGMGCVCVSILCRAFVAKKKQANQLALACDVLSHSQRGVFTKFIIRPPKYAELCHSQNLTI